MLPERIHKPLRAHLERVKTVHQRDLAQGWGAVEMLDASIRKYPNAASEWRWQWGISSAAKVARNPKSGEQGRHHMHPSIV